MGADCGMAAFSMRPLLAAISLGAEAHEDNMMDIESNTIQILFFFIFSPLSKWVCHLDAFLHQKVPTTPQPIAARAARGVRSS